MYFSLPIWWIKINIFTCRNVTHLCNVFCPAHLLHILTLLVIGSFWQLAPLKLLWIAASVSLRLNLASYKSFSQTVLNRFPSDWANWLSPSSLKDSIRAVMVGWRLGGKIIGTILCCVVYDSCAQWYAH